MESARGNFRTQLDRVNSPVKGQQGSSVNVKGLPARVDRVAIEGLQRTKDDYVENQIKRLFDVTEFQDLMISSMDIAKSLEKAGCFRDVEVLIDTNKRAGASENGYTVVFDVDEYRPAIGTVRTSVGVNDGGALILGLKFPNLAGRGESINLEYTLEADSTHLASVAFHKPHPGRWNLVSKLGVYHNYIRNNYSSYNCFADGGFIGVDFNSAKNISHSMDYGLEMRHLEALSKSTSVEIRKQVGTTIRSVLRHIMKIDYRDDLVFPSKGFYLKLEQEFAGLGGDVAYMKHRAQVQLNVPLPQQFVAQGSLHFGFLKPLDDDVTSHSVHDLFYLGGASGPHNLRGFNMRGVGSKSRSDILGGRAFWSAGLHLWTPMPSPPRRDFGKYFRCHAFANIGNITPVSFVPEEIGETINTLLKNFRLAYGVGFAFRLGSATRVELNYCFPIKFVRGDSLARGLQVGIGVEFL